jgi:Spy/CpxP family protein refolding chaperone
MMPPHLREELDLSDDQVTQLDALHKETREKFEKILTAEQLEKLKEHHPPRPPHERERDE